MFHDVEFSCLFLYAICLTARANYDPFSDNIQFSVNFPGPLSQSAESDPMSLPTSDEHSVVVTTENKEKYKCVIPMILGDQAQKENIRNYKGRNEAALLKPLFEQSSCSYKIEPYWTYELCHAKHLRQYHEEKDVGKDVKLQEYYLGKFRKKETEGQSNEQSKPEDEAEKIDKSKVVQVGGSNFPYFEVNFDDGTPCDLTGQPRKTSVKYICHELGRGEIYDLKEVSTCEYEVIILTQLLCSHPRYQPQKDPINKIQCHSIDNSPNQPSSLVDFEMENSQGRYNRKDFFEPEDATVKIMIGPDGIMEEQIKPDPKKTTPQQEAVRKEATVRQPDKQLLQDFLSGEYCIQGGSGWWKHEFCYGRAVTQFHEDQSGKIVIALGRWNQDTHVKWIKDNPSKMPDKQPKKKKVPTATLR